MSKVAFYLMSSKGYSTLIRFLELFDSANISYVVSDQDVSVKNDPFLKIKKMCESHDIRFYRRSEFPPEIEKSFKGYKFAIGWRWLITNINNLIVLHDSLLPKYRGFAPLVNSLINQEEVIGVTALFANHSYDNGDIISQKKIKLSYPIKIERAIKLVEPIYFDLIKSIYIDIKLGKVLKGVKQCHDQASYSLWLDEFDYFIDWSWSAEKIKCFIDAVGYPYDYAKSYVNDQVVKIIDAETVDDVFVENRERHVGKVLFLKGSPIIVCRTGLIKLKIIKSLSGETIALNFRTRFK